MTFRALLLLLLLHAVLPGEAKTFTIESRPSGALVFMNGSEVGTTPYVYTYTRVPDAPFAVELRMEGYEERSIDLIRVLHDTRACKRPLVVNMYRDHPELVKRTDVPVVTMNINLPPNKEFFGNIGSTKAKRDCKQLGELTYPDQLTSRVIGAFRNTFASAISARKATQRGDEAIRHARFYLQPVLKDLQFNMDEYDHYAYGDVQTTIEWRVISGTVKDSVLFSTEKTTTWMACRDNEYGLLEEAVRDAARQFVDEEGLQEKLDKETQHGIQTSKGAVVDINKPAGIKFEGRKDMLAALVKGVVTVKTDDGHGSGFLIASDGYIITNAHVVGDQSKVTVKFNQGFTLDGQVVKVNHDFDLALIKTPGEDLPALVLGDDNQLLVGEELFAIGTPLDEQLGQTVTRGIMSGRREFDGRTFLQTDVSINPGNSGGPLIDESGKVVGVTTLKISDAGIQGIGFAVPVGKMVEMLNLKFKDR